MTKKLLLSLLLTSSCVLLYLNSKIDEAPKLPETFNSEDLAEYKIAMKKYKKKNGYIKSDKPKKYAEILYQMKVRKNETASGYALGYKNQALKIANQRSNARANSETLQWIERGPANSPGRTRTLVVDPNDNTNSTWIVGAVGGGIWKTADKGNTWDNLTDTTLPNLAISNIVVSPSNSKIWYAGTGEGFFGTGSIKGNGILKSTDSGSTWNFLSSTEGNSNFEVIYKIIIDPNNASTLLAATSSSHNNYTSYGLFKSTDGGENWANVYSNANNYIQSIIHEPNNFNVQYATISGSDIIKSEDAGETWNSIVTSGIKVTGRTEIGVSSIDTNIIFASTASDGNGSTDGVLYISRDKGISWSHVDLNNNDYNYLGGQGWYDHVVLPHPLNKNIVYLAGVSIFKVTVDETNNNGVMVDVTDAYDEYNGNGPNSVWSGNLENPLHPDQHSLQFTDVNANDSTFKLIVTNDGGVYYTSQSKIPGEADGDWVFAGKGLNTTQLYDIDKKAGEDRYFFGTQDNGSWITPKGESASKTTVYNDVIGGDGFASVWHKKDSDKLIGSYTNNDFYLSFDGGDNFTPITTFSNDLTDIKHDAPFISQLGAHVNASDTLFTVGASGVWKSTDFGQSWNVTAITDGWQNASFIDIAVSEASPHVIWAGSGMDDNQSVQVSIDGGRTFTKTTNYIPSDNAYLGNISGIATSSNDSSTAYIMFSFAGSPKVIKTTDLGKTWSDISGFETSPSAKTASSDIGFPDVAVYDILEFPNNADTLWAATEIGIFETKNGGQSWIKLDANLPAVSIWELKIVDEQVIAATHGRGAWTYNLKSDNDGDGNGDGDSITTSIEIPTLFDIALVKSPIVSGENLAISINSEMKTLLHIEIISLNGKSLYSNKYSTLQKGKYNMVIEHSDLPRGIYVLKLNYNEQIKSIKFSVQ